MTRRDAKKTSDASPKKDTRDAVESAISRAKGDRRITWEAALARTHKKVSKWEESESSHRRKRSVA